MLSFIEKILREREVSRMQDIKQLEAEYRADVFQIEKELDKMKWESSELQKEVEIFKQKGKCDKLSRSLSRTSTVSLTTQSASDRYAG